MANSTATPALSLSDIQMAFHNFGIVDYIVFAGMLIGCSGIGLYFALRSKPSKGSDEADEYLLGGRQMTLFPVSMSLIASFISGITLLGTPTEVYLNGTEYMFIVFSYIIAGYIGLELIIPVFYNLQVSSAYEYLNLRFDNRVRLLGSVLFAVGMCIWLPIVIYVPALAFNQVTGVNVHVVTPIVCIVCILYTCVGGLKAVVWTDVVQTIIMIGAMLTIIIKSTIDVGGVSEVFSKNWESGRLEVPSFIPNPTIRHSVLSLVIGSSIHQLKSAIVNQNMVQRFLTLPSYNTAKRALWIYVAGIMSFILMCGYMGLVVYANYYDCDPLTTGLAKAKDQVVPLLVMKSTGQYVGLPGLFVAGVFSAALSSLSTGLNSMSAVALEDFIRPNCATPLSERATKIILRSIVLIFGAICVALVFVVEKLGSVLVLSMSLQSISSGPSLGLFIMGVTLPWMNATGAFYGGIIGMLCNAVIILGQQQAQAAGAMKIIPKVTSVIGCDYTFGKNVSSTVSAIIRLAADLEPKEEANAIFRISYLMFTLIGVCTSIFFGAIISYATGNNDIHEKDPKLFSPFVQRWLAKQRKDVQEKKTFLEKENEKFIGTNGTIPTS